MTDKAFLTDLICKLAELGDVTFRPMMGEYLMYVNGRYVACVCDNTLFLKKFDTNAEFLSNCPQRPPYSGAKPLYAVNADDVEYLKKAVALTYSGAPQKKK